MNGMNRVFLVGYVGSEPELMQSKNGQPYARLSLATKRAQKTEGGEWETKTDWHRIMVWGRQAQQVHTYLHKGAALAVEGHLSHYRVKEDDESPGMPMTSVVADEIQFLNNPKRSKEAQFAESAT